MMEIKPSEPYPDEIFYAAFDIPDNIERQKYIEELRRIARDQKRATEFARLFKQFQMDYQNRMRQTGGKTRFTDQPLELSCGEWNADDLGVRTFRFDKNMMSIKITACSHPILPVEILKNVDTAEERITLAYFKSGAWQRITVDRSVCANTNKIVDALSQYGIEVTSDNAKHLVRYLSDCVGYNPVALEPKKSVSRLGWAGASFIPYETNIRYEENPQFASIYRSVREAGDFSAWRSVCGGLRKDVRIRLLMGASFASALLEAVHALPFVCHIWGKSGTGKTVALMVAMSIWGCPKLGGLVKTMNATTVGITRNAAFLCSIPFAGDELQTIKNKWVKNYDQLIYQVTEGVERIRGRRWGGVEETMTWKNTFLFSGEEPIVKTGSSDGTKNRVIEIFIEQDAPLIDDGHYISGFMQENYGFAGRRFVEYLQQEEPEKLVERYRERFEVLCRLDTTDKQAMSMACILLADELASTLFWPDEQPIKQEDWEVYLKHISDVDSVDQAFDAVLNWAARNPIRFEDPKADDSPNKGEVWGRIEVNKTIGRDVLVVNRDVLLGFLQQNDYDYTAMTRGWAERGYILKNSQGKSVHSTKVYGIKATYVKFVLPESNDDADEEGFMAVDSGQIKLPFD